MHLHHPVTFFISPLPAKRILHFTCSRSCYPKHCRPESSLPLQLRRAQKADVGTRRTHSLSLPLQSTLPLYLKRTQKTDVGTRTAHSLSFHQVRHCTLLFLPPELVVALYPTPTNVRSARRSTPSQEPFLPCTLEMSTDTLVNSFEKYDTLAELTKILDDDDLRLLQSSIREFWGYPDRELWVIWNFAYEKARQSRSPLPKRLARKVRRDCQQDFPQCGPGFRLALEDMYKYGCPE